MKIVLTHVFLIFLLSSVTPVSAERLYKWVDDFGNVSYRDRPPRYEEEGYRVEQKDIRTNSSSDNGLGATVRRYKFPVVLYSANKCASCDLTRDYLVKKNIPFKEKNVQDSQDLADELTKLSGAYSVPVVTVGEKVIKGFAQRWLDSELEQAGYFNSTAQAEAVESEEEDQESDQETADSNELDTDS